MKILQQFVVCQVGHGTLDPGASQQTSDHNHHCCRPGGARTPRSEVKREQNEWKNNYYGGDVMKQKGGQKKEKLYVDIIGALTVSMFSTI